MPRAVTLLRRHPHRRFLRSAMHHQERRRESKRQKSKAREGEMAEMGQRSRRSRISCAFHLSRRSRGRSWRGLWRRLGGVFWERERGRGRRNRKTKRKSRPRDRRGRTGEKARAKRQTKTQHLHHLHPFKLPSHPPPSAPSGLSTSRWASCHFATARPSRALSHSFKPSTSRPSSRKPKPKPKQSPHQRLRPLLLHQQHPPP